MANRSGRIKPDCCYNPWRVGTPSPNCGWCYPLGTLRGPPKPQLKFSLVSVLADRNPPGGSPLTANDRAELLANYRSARIALPGGAHSDRMHWAARIFVNSAARRELVSETAALRELADALDVERFK